MRDNFEPLSKIKPLQYWYEIENSSLIHCYWLDSLLFTTMDWIGLDWIGLDWIGLDWIRNSSSERSQSRVPFTRLFTDTI